LAVPLSWVVALLARRCAGTRAARLLPADVADIPIGLWGAARVVLYMCILFNTTLVNYFLEMLTCIPSPHGPFTVATYPHIECKGSDAEFVVLAPLAATLSAFYIGGFAFTLRKAIRDCLRCMAATGRQERGWFGFAVEDYRDEHISWALIFVAKDVMLVLVAMTLAGEGAAQLLVSATLLIAVIVLLVQQCPFQDWSNTLLEVWNTALAAAVCLYSAGMGFGSSPSTDDVTELFQDGKDDHAYRARAVGMVVMQTLTIAVPVTVMAYQLLLVSSRCRGFCPRRCQPSTKEEVEEWTSHFEDNMTKNGMMRTIRNFDSVEFRFFRQLIERTPASMGVMLARMSQSTVIKKVRSSMAAGSEEGTSEDEKGAEDYSALLKEVDRLKSENAREAQSAEEPDKTSKEAQSKKPSRAGEESEGTFTEAPATKVLQSGEDQRATRPRSPEAGGLDVEGGGVQSVVIGKKSCSSEARR